MDLDNETEDDPGSAFWRGARDLALGFFGLVAVILVVWYGLTWVFDLIY